MTVLDGLWKVKELFAPTLAWRSSCRMGICGSCGMLINGRPRLACNTQIAELESDVVAVAPLPNFGIIKDLVPDLAPDVRDPPRAACRTSSARTRRSRTTRPASTGSRRTSSSTTCSSATASSAGAAWRPARRWPPTPATPGRCRSPQAHRYNSDTRDGGFERRARCSPARRGPWRCHFAGECSQVCPKGVDPAKAIQLMKRELVFDLLRLAGGGRRRRGRGAPRDPGEGIPAAPARTVGGEP